MIDQQFKDKLLLMKLENKIPDSREWIHILANSSEEQIKYIISKYPNDISYLYLAWNKNISMKFLNKYLNESSDKLWE